MLWFQSQAIQLCTWLIGCFLQPINLEVGFPPTYLLWLICIFLVMRCPEVSAASQVQSPQAHQVNEPHLSAPWHHSSGSPAQPHNDGSASSSPCNITALLALVFFQHKCFYLSVGRFVSDYLHAQRSCINSLFQLSCGFPTVSNLSSLLCVIL